MLYQKPYMLNSCTDCPIYVLHSMYRRTGTNICSKYHVSVLEERFKDRHETSLTAPGSSWAWIEKLIAFVSPKYQPDNFVLTVWHSNCQATRTGCLNEHKWKISDPENFHWNLCSRVIWGVLQISCQNIYYRQQPRIKKKKVNSISTIHFSAIHLLTFWRLSGRTKPRGTHNDRLPTNKSSNKIGFRRCRRSQSSENAECFPL